MAEASKAPLELMSKVPRQNSHSVAMPTRLKLAKPLALTQLLCVLAQTRPPTAQFLAAIESGDMRAALALCKPSKSLRAHQMRTRRSVIGG